MTEIKCEWVNCAHNRNGKCAGQKVIELVGQEDDDDNTHEECLICKTYELKESLKTT